jgi:two-component system, OmpR family, response regulator BaeR
MQQKTVLIAEDEPKIARLLEEYLREHGDFQTATLHRGDEVPLWVVRHAPDLVLLDVMLPGLDGLEVCKQIRKYSTVPIIMITARTEEIDRLLGLELGADDYICKPFSPREVVARVRAVLRRAASGTGASDVVAGLSIDRERHRASLNGKSLALTPVELALLSALTAQPGRVFTRDQLMNVMYSDYRVVTDRAVDAHIRNLRRKLQALDPTREFIESVYGVGYLACQEPK